MTKIANALLSVLILSLLAVAATVTVPPLFGLTPVNIVAGSMTGTFDFGTIVLVDPSKTPAVNDVVTWKAGANSPVTHRIVRIQPDASGNGIEYITKGDANLTDDPQPVPPAYIIGVVESHIPYAGLATTLLGLTHVQVFLGSIALALYYLSNRRPSQALPAAAA